jgi:phenylacetate-CoA ligase
LFNNKLYIHSPIVIQNILLSARALLRKLLRENKNSALFEKRITLLERSNSELDRYGDDALASIIEHASEGCEYYKGQHKLSEFNVISKSVVQRNQSSFVNKNATGPSIAGSTSGTTGSPLSIPQNIDSVVKEQGFISRYLKWAGFEEGDRRAWIRGDLIVPIEQKNAPFWRYSYFENMILLSSFHMSSKVLPQYIQSMVSYGVDIIQAYPSSIVTLAKYLESKDEYYPGVLKSIITSSESLSKGDKILVEKRFNCTVFDWYGLFERVAAIGSCEHGRYHIFSDYSHVELLPAGDVDGKSRAEIVGTNFNNSLYPLIRYKTGDYVTLSDEDSCPCGRVYPIIDSIEGRIGDYLIGENGNKVSILNHIPKGVGGLIATQFIQDVANEVILLVVVDDQKFTQKDEMLLIKNTQGRLGKTIKVSVKKVVVIPRTKNGKVRQAICSLKENS